jgi:hypothetical protein
LLQLRKQASKGYVYKDIFFYKFFFVTKFLILLRPLKKSKMEAVKPNLSDNSEDVIRGWFESFIESVSLDKFMMDNKIASKETDSFYRNIIFNKPEAHRQARKLSTIYFLENILKDYLNELSNFGRLPKKLALDFSEAKILVWAEILDDDEDTEDSLILSEARANSKYSGDGFYISSTIVEQGDKLPVPPHYKQINVH